MVGVTKAIPHLNYNSGYPDSNIALLKLEREVPYLHVLQLCHERQPECNLLGSCGMGRISVVYPNLEPLTLREMHLREDKGSFFNRCPKDTVCTKRMTEDANLCKGDEGAPLYAFHPDSYYPKCLLGVGAYFGRTRYTRLSCSGGSFYSSVPHYLTWIREMMATN
ncbi:serine protease 41-like [Convolutriloba macropyga]|uniref:serine protease 41-like n=1 Tax=Convolutriloba macropyga TaxID=536237 RepID=UPI003F526C51